MGILKQSSREITLHKFVISNSTLSLVYKEDEINIIERINKLCNYSVNKDVEFSKSEISLLKETFGKEFLTKAYFLTDYEKIISHKASRGILTSDDFAFARVVA